MKITPWNQGIISTHLGCELNWILGRVTVWVGQTTTVFQQATRTKSAFCPHRDGKWVSAKMRRRSAGWG